MGLFKSWRSKGSVSKTLKDNSSVLSAQDKDVSTDFGPQPTNYGNSSKGGKGADKARQQDASKSGKGRNDGRANAKLAAPALSTADSSQSITRPGKNGSPPITPKSPARQAGKQGGGEDSNDSQLTKLSNVVATGPALERPSQQASQHQPALSTSTSGMTRTTSRTSQMGDTSGNPRPSELFAGKGVQWDAVKLAGPGSAPAEQNRQATASNTEDMQQFLKMRRQWKPHFVGTDDLDDAARFQPPKDLNKLTFGAAESQMPSRGLMSLDDLEKSHSRKQQLLDDQPLGGSLLEPVAESSKSAAQKPMLAVQSSTLPKANSATSPSKPKSGIASAFNFTRKGSAASVKRKESTGSEGRKASTTPAMPVPSGAPALAAPSAEGYDLSSGSLGSNTTATQDIPKRSSSYRPNESASNSHANGDAVHAAGIAPDGTVAVAPSESANGLTNGHSTNENASEPTSATTAKPDYASGNLEAPLQTMDPTSAVNSTAKPDFASGNLEAMPAMASGLPASGEHLGAPESSAVDAMHRSHDGVQA